MNSRINARRKRLDEGDRDDVHDCAESDATPNSLRSRSFASVVSGDDGDYQHHDQHQHSRRGGHCVSNTVDRVDTHVDVDVDVEGSLQRQVAAMRAQLERTASANRRLEEDMVNLSHHVVAAEEEDEVYSTIAADRSALDHHTTNAHKSKNHHAMAEAVANDAMDPLEYLRTISNASSASRPPNSSSAHYATVQANRRERTPKSSTAAPTSTKTAKIPAQHNTTTTTNKSSDGPTLTLQLLRGAAGNSNARVNNASANDADAHMNTADRNGVSNKPTAPTAALTSTMMANHHENDDGGVVSRCLSTVSVNTTATDDAEGDGGGEGEARQLSELLSSISEAAATARRNSAGQGSRRGGGTPSLAVPSSSSHTPVEIARKLQTIDAVIQKETSKMGGREEKERSSSIRSTPSRPISTAMLIDHSVNTSAANEAQHIDAAPSSSFDPTSVLANIDAIFSRKGTGGSSASVAVMMSNRSISHASSRGGNERNHPRDDHHQAIESNSHAHHKLTPFGRGGDHQQNVYATYGDADPKEEEENRIRDGDGLVSSRRNTNLNHGDAINATHQPPPHPPPTSTLTLAAVDTIPNHSLFSFPLGATYAETVNSTSRRPSFDGGGGVGVGVGGGPSSLLWARRAGEMRGGGHHDRKETNALAKTEELSTKKEESSLQPDAVHSQQQQPARHTNDGGSNHPAVNDANHADNDATENNVSSSSPPPAPSASSLPSEPPTTPSERAQAIIDSLGPMPQPMLYVEPLVVDARGAIVKSPRRTVKGGGGAVLGGGVGSAIGDGVPSEAHRRDDDHDHQHRGPKRRSSQQRLPPAAAHGDHHRGDDRNAAVDADVGEERDGEEDETATEYGFYHTESEHDGIGHRTPLPIPLARALMDHHHNPTTSIETSSSLQAGGGGPSNGMMATPVRGGGGSVSRGGDHNHHTNSNGGQRRQQTPQPLLEAHRHPSAEPSTTSTTTRSGLVSNRMTTQRGNGEGSIAGDREGGQQRFDASTTSFDIPLMAHATTPTPATNGRNVSTSESGGGGGAGGYLPPTTFLPEVFIKEYAHVISIIDKYAALHHRQQAGNSGRRGPSPGATAPSSVVTPPHQQQQQKRASSLTPSQGGTAQNAHHQRHYPRQYHSNGRQQHNPHHHQHQHDNSSREEEERRRRRRSISSPASVHDYRQENHGDSRRQSIATTTASAAAGKGGATGDRGASVGGSTPPFTEERPLFGQTPEQRAVLRSNIAAESARSQAELMKKRCEWLEEAVSARDERIEAQNRTIKKLSKSLDTLKSEEEARADEVDAMIAAELESQADVRQRYEAALEEKEARISLLSEEVAFLHDALKSAQNHVTLAITSSSDTIKKAMSTPRNSSGGGSAPPRTITMGRRNSHHHHHRDADADVSHNKKGVNYDDSPPPSSSASSSSSDSETPTLADEMPDDEEEEQQQQRRHHNNHHSHSHRQKYNPSPSSFVSSPPIRSILRREGSPKGTGGAATTIPSSSPPTVRLLNSQRDAVGAAYGTLNATPTAAAPYRQQGGEEAAAQYSQEGDYRPQPLQPSPRGHYEAPSVDPSGLVGEGAGDVSNIISSPPLPRYSYTDSGARGERGDSPYHQLPGSGGGGGRVGGFNSHSPIIPPDQHIRLNYLPSSPQQHISSHPPSASHLLSDFSPQPHHHHHDHQNGLLLQHGGIPIMPATALAPNAGGGGGRGMGDNASIAAYFDSATAPSSSSPHASRYRHQINQLAHASDASRLHGGITMDDVAAITPHGSSHTTNHHPQRRSNSPHHHAYLQNQNGSGAVGRTASPTATASNLMALRNAQHRGNNTNNYHSRSSTPLGIPVGRGDAPSYAYPAAAPSADPTVVYQQELAEQRRLLQQLAKSREAHTFGSADSVARSNTSLAHLGHVGAAVLSSPPSSSSLAPRTGSSPPQHHHHQQQQQYSVPFASVPFSAHVTVPSAFQRQQNIKLQQQLAEEEEAERRGRLGLGLGSVVGASSPSSSLAFAPRHRQGSSRSNSPMTAAMGGGGGGGGGITGALGGGVLGAAPPIQRGGGLAASSSLSCNYPSSPPRAVPYYHGPSSSNANTTPQHHYSAGNNGRQGSSSPSRVLPGYASPLAHLQQQQGGGGVRSGTLRQQPASPPSHTYSSSLSANAFTHCSDVPPRLIPPRL